MHLPGQRTVVWIIIALLIVTFVLTLLTTRWHEPATYERISGPTKEAQRLLDQIHKP